MTGRFLFRLLLDGLAAALLLLCLAYWWLGNLTHEIAGTAMFVLLVAHNVFNRRWYGVAARRPDARSRINLIATFALLAAMLLLVVTSLFISRTLASFIPPLGGFTMRQLHVLAGYWVLVAVGLHLGLRWPILMDVARLRLGLGAAGPMRRAGSRLVAVGVAAHGLWSAQMIGLSDRLAMHMTLDWWNFEESVAPFFIHCVAVLGLVIVATHYGLLAVKALTSRFARPDARSRQQAPVKEPG